MHFQPQDSEYGVHEEVYPRRQGIETFADAAGL